MNDGVPIETNSVACDRCLALSYLTVTLAKVPRFTPEERGDGTFGPDPAAGLDPTPSALISAVDEMTASRAANLQPLLRDWAPIAVREDCLRTGLAALCTCMDAYPAGLRDLADPPPVLYVRGDRAVLERCPDEAIAMVGTRRPTLVGREAARRIGAGITRSGGVIVSGMALGIDAASHEGALSVGGPTVAVLASGADLATPASHRRLYEEILERGAVVSEMPPGTRPFTWGFPARNRIIAALARATVVVEAPLRSGALITVEQAMEIGRDLYAVPGSLASDTCEGTNRMLCDGAMAVVDGADLAMRRGLGGHGNALAGPVDGPLAEVHEALRRGPLSLDEVGRRTASLGPGEIELALLDLELAGWISRRPDGRYRVVDRWVA